MSASQTRTMSRVAWRPLVAATIGSIGALWLLLTQSPVFAAVVSVVVIVAVAVLRAPWIAYLLLVASVPAQQFIGIPAGGRYVTATQLSFIVAVGALGLWLTSGRHEIQASWMFIPLGLLLTVMLISAAFAEFPRPALAETGRWIVVATAFVLGVQFIPNLDEPRVTPFVIALALGGIFEAGFGVVQSILALGPEGFLLDSGVSRAFGTFGKPNTYAGFLEMVFFPVFAVGVYYVVRSVRTARDYRITRIEGFAAGVTQRNRLLLQVVLAIFLLGSSALILSGIVASLSRGAWLGVLAGLMFTGLLASRWLRIASLFAVPLGVLLLISGGLDALPAPIEERLSRSAGQFELLDPSNAPIYDENFATLERLAHWHAGWAMFESAPVIGIGVGNFDARYDDFWVRQEFRFSRGHAHNYYIHTLAETGLMGLLAYVWLIGGIITLALLSLRRSISSYQRYVVLGGLGTVVAVAVHNLVENLHVLNLGITQAFVWSLIVAASRSTAEGS